MSHDDVIKLILLLSMGGIVYLFISGKQKNKTVIVDNNPVSTNVPWYLTYNYPTGFTGGSISLPSKALGQDAATGNPGHCDTCNLFPTVNTSRL